MSIHPSPENRLTFARGILPEAKAIFERTKETQRTDAHNVTPCLLSLGEKARVHLKKRKAEDYMKPEALLKRIEDRMSRLELTLVVLMEANKNVKLDGVKQQALAETTDSLVAVNEAKVSTSK